MKWERQQSFYLNCNASGKVLSIPKTYSRFYRGACFQGFCLLKRHIQINVLGQQPIWLRQE